MNLASNVLVASIESLRESTQNSWPISGGADVYEWARYARRMNNVISTAIPVLAQVAEHERQVEAHIADMHARNEALKAEVEDLKKQLANIPS